MQQQFVKHFTEGEMREQYIVEFVLLSQFELTCGPLKFPFFMLDVVPSLPRWWFWWHDEDDFEWIEVLGEYLELMAPLADSEWLVEWWSVGYMGVISSGWVQPLRFNSSCESFDIEDVFFGSDVVLKRSCPLDWIGAWPLIEVVIINTRTSCIHVTSQQVQRN